MDGDIVLPPLKPELAVERLRNKVTLEITCADHYAAMELYDRLVAACKSGAFKFSLEVTPHA